MIQHNGALRNRADSQKTTMNSSSSSSTSETAAMETQLPSSTSPSPPPSHLSLQSPQLQAEFLRECRSRFQFHEEDSEVQSPSPFTPSSPLPSPFSPTATSSPSSSLSSPFSPGRQACLSLPSPELLSELKDPRSHSLRQVRTRKGLTTVFSGRGRGAGRGGWVSGPAHSASQTNQKDQH